MVQVIANLLGERIVRYDWVREGRGLGLCLSQVKVNLGGEGIVVYISN